jgi:hypothetical protein
MQPVLMQEHKSGWWMQVVNASIDEHADAPMKFEVVELAWCAHCHSPNAATLTADVRAALDMYSNTTILADRLRIVLRRFELAQTKEKFHHA